MRPTSAPTSQLTANSTVSKQAPAVKRSNDDGATFASATNLDRRRDTDRNMQPASPHPISPGMRPTFPGQLFRLGRGVGGGWADVPLVASDCRVEPLALPGCQVLSFSNRFLFLCYFSLRSLLSTFSSPSNLRNPHFSTYLLIHNIYSYPQY